MQPEVTHSESNTPERLHIPDAAEHVSHVEHAIRTPNQHKRNLWRRPSRLHNPDGQFH
jgi:hypothetical protein